MQVGELVYNGAFGMGIVIADAGWSCRVVQWIRGGKTCICRKKVSGAEWNAGACGSVRTIEKEKNLTEIFSLEGMN